MNIKSNFINKYFTLYFFLIIFMLPLVFIQKCEDAYYLPKLALLAGAAQFFVPVLFNLKSLKLNLIDYSAFIFLILSAAGIIFASHKTTAFMRFAEWAGAFAVFFYARHILKPGDIKRAVILMVCSSSLVALYALLQALNFDLTGWITDFSGRAFSSLGNPDFLGGFLVITVPLAVYVSRETGYDKISVFLFAFLSITLFLSQTRSSIAAYAVVFLVMFILFFDFFRKNYLYMIAGLIVAVILIQATGRGHGLMSRFAAAAAGGNPDMSGRYDMWQAGLNMFKAHPLTGTGAGSIKNIYCMYANSAPYMETEHLHNDFIEIAAENGIFIWLAFMAFLGSVFYGLVRKKETLAFVAAASFIGMCVQAVFNFPFFIIDTKLYFFVIMGLALNESMEIRINRAQAVTAAVIAVMITVISFMFLTESMYLNAGINNMQAKNSAAAVYNLQKAEKYYYDAKPAFYLAALSGDLGKTADAVLYSKKYMEQSPCSKNGFMQYSINTAESGDTVTALALLDKFLNMYPSDKDALNNKGKMLYMAGRVPESLKIYNYMVSTYPADETTHNNLYGIYFNGKMFKEAEKEKLRWETRR